MIARWSQPNGYRQVLAISLPLVASMGSITVMQFTDRMFLANYSVSAIAAAVPAGIASFTFASFFVGVANYTNAFVAQYTGAGRFDRVGASLWQSIYFGIGSAICLALLYFVAPFMFDAIGHSSQIKELEVIYFRILILGAGLQPLSSVLSCFYSGRGLTRTVMVVHLIGAVINIPLDYAMINGWGPFPEMGIAGAAIATVMAYGIITALFVVLIFTRDNEARFKVWTNRALDQELFGRLMKYGLPSGVQFFLGIFGFAFFFLMIGRLGDLELVVSNIAFSIEMLSFLPMVGLHIGVATLVGQAIGKGRVEDGVEATKSAVHLCLVYMLGAAALFILFPEPLLLLFKTGTGTEEDWAALVDLGTILLRFVAVYAFFDALNLVYSGALKGAGDTKFIMWTIAALSVGVMIVPIYVAIEFLDAGLYAAWSICAAYIVALGLAFMLRYRQGNWKEMKVIEDTD